MAAAAAFPAIPIQLIANARRDPAKARLALLWLGVVLGAAALALIIFKPPAGLFLHLHGSARGYVYYGLLGAVVIFALAEASFGYWWVVADDVNGCHAAAGSILIWISIFGLVLVLALGGLAFLK